MQLWVQRATRAGYLRQCIGQGRRGPEIIEFDTEFEQGARNAWRDSCQNAFGTDQFNRFGHLAQVIRCPLVHTCQSGYIDDDVARLLLDDGFKQGFKDSGGASIVHNAHEGKHEH